MYESYRIPILYLPFKVIFLSRLFAVPRLDLGDTADHDTPELETDRVSHESFFDEPMVPLTGMSISRTASIICVIKYCTQFAYPLKEAVKR